VNSTYLNAIATHGASLITYIGLVDDLGQPVGDARKAVAWTAATDGLIRPTTNLVFDMTSGDDVAGWRGYSAATGGTDYDGASLTPVSFSNDGTYTLNAAQTGIDHSTV
jgi:hypothetical protein